MPAALRDTQALAAGRPPRRRVLLALTALFGVIVAAAIAEVVARGYGFQPRRYTEPRESALHAPDSMLGWRQVPGHYHFPPLVADGTPVDITIRPDGSRETGGAPPDGRPELLAVGCSMTMGWGVSDAQTWTWRVQELRPDLYVVNRGVSGYGTLQSLLTLEEVLDGAGPPPRHVVYGLIDHGMRNAATASWLRALSYMKHPAATPYCTMTRSEGFECHQPVAYPALPFDGYLAAVTVLEQHLLWAQAGGRQRMGVPVTRQLINDMADVCRSNHIGFSVVLLNLPERLVDTYVPLLRRRHIDVIDCNQQFGAADIVPGDVHPNAAVHRRWGDCIAAALSAPERLPAR